MILTVIINNIE